jgi:hypothetical protein
MQVKCEVSTETQQPGKQGGGDMAYARGERHAKAMVVAGREDRRHVERR